jgi:hypothetical protein
VKNRSRELDEVRQLLFPRLTEHEGWAKIDRAFEGAADPRKQQAIEALAVRELQDPAR